MNIRNLCVLGVIASVLLSACGDRTAAEVWNLSSRPVFIAAGTGGDGGEVAPGGHLRVRLAEGDMVVFDAKRRELGRVHHRGRSGRSEVLRVEVGGDGSLTVRSGR